MDAKNICRDYCTGCGVCASTCPRKAISMKEDSKGFNIPYVDNSLCINCMKCVKICNSEIDFHDNIRTYIAKHRDKEIYGASQSGGAFTAISDYILEFNGVVYGAALNDHFELLHVRVTKQCDRDIMRGSKYIQSRIDTIYTQLKEDLELGRHVLFVGTGCQVSGIKKFVREQCIDDSKLYTVDILCHGVPSILLWRNMLQYIERNYHSHISSIVFKQVEENTRPEICFLISDNYIPDRIFRKLYYSNLALRNSCYCCKYTHCQRVGDLTIGDAWGVKVNNPEFYDGKGVSLILINTKKGVEIERFLDESMELMSVDLMQYRQECLTCSARTKRSPEEFWNDYFNKPFGYIVKKYAKHNIFLNIPYILKRVKSKLLRRGS